MYYQKSIIICLRGKTHFNNNIYGGRGLRWAMITVADPAPVVLLWSGSIINKRSNSDPDLFTLISDPDSKFI